MSTTTTTTPSSLSRPYIGARRDRNYINNCLTSSPLSNDYCSSTTSLTKSLRAIQSGKKNDLSNVETTDNFQTQQEEQASVKHFSSTILRDEQQLHQQQEQKAKDCLSSSSTASSLFLFPTTHNSTPLSACDHSSPSFVKEHQHFHQLSHQNEQPLSNENKNNQRLLLDEFKQQNEEPQKHKQSSTHSSTNRNQNVDLSDIPKENNSFSSLYPLSAAVVEHRDDDNQSHLRTSTPTLPLLTSYHPTTSNNIFASLSSDKTNNNKTLFSPLDNLLDQSSSISTINFQTNLQPSMDDRKLDNMSLLSTSVRHASIPVQHPYDQRISDQGNKYIIQLKTDEYQENEFIITPRHSLNQIIIDAKHREEDSFGGFVHRELHKIFNIPKHIDLNQYAYTYNKRTQELTIEMPYLQTSSTTNENKNNISFTSSIQNPTGPLTYSFENRDRNSGENNLSTPVTRSNHYNDSKNTGGIDMDSTLMRSSKIPVAPTYESSIGSTKPFDFDLFHRSAFRPQIIGATTNDNNNNAKKLIMSLDLSDYQAEDIKVSVKDRELIVNAERKTESGTRKSRSSFFQSTSVPPQTDIEHLQTNYINGKLVIEAPYLDSNNLDKRIKTNTNSSSNQQQSNRQIVTDSRKRTTFDDLFQQRTETLKEFVRVCGLPSHFST